MGYRSLLFTPGTDKKRLYKSLETEADAVIWDLEDAVHPNDKKLARQVIGNVLTELDDSGKDHKPILIRVNQIGSPWFEADMEVPAHREAAGVILPKAEGAEQLKQAYLLMNKENGVLIPIIETAIGLVKVEEICSFDNLAGVALGAVDLAVDLDLVLTSASLELAYAKSRIVTYARAEGITAIYDSVFPDIKNEEGLREIGRFTRNCGFTGQMAIHPAQVTVINDIYSPNADEVKWATAIIEMIERDANGKGVFTFEGKMIDKPVIAKAQQIYQKATRFGLLPGM